MSDDRSSDIFILRENVGWQIVVNRPSFDNAQSHVTAFRPISEAARSWSDDNVSCTLLLVKRWNRSIVISMSSICLQEYRRNCMSDLHQSFCACYQYLWPRLSPLAALQCLTDDVIFAHFTGPHGGMSILQWQVTSLSHHVPSNSHGLAAPYWLQWQWRVPRQDKSIRQGVPVVKPAMHYCLVSAQHTIFKCSVCCSNSMHHPC